MRRIILESVASKVARTKRDMSRFLKSTFLCVSQPQPDAAAVKAALGFLTEKKFVEKTKAFAAPPGQGPRRSLLDTPTALLCREERKAKKALLQSLWEEKRRQPLESVYFATQLGDATFFSGLSPSEALFMKDVFSLFLRLCVCFFRNVGLDSKILLYMFFY